MLPVNAITSRLLGIERSGQGFIERDKYRSGAGSVVVPEASYEDTRIVLAVIRRALSINRLADCNRDTICLLPSHCGTWKEPR